MKGINIPDLGTGREPLRSDIIQALKRRGLNHARIPVDAERVMPRFSSATAATDYLAALFADIRKILDLGMSISIDLHSQGPFGKHHRSTNDAVSDILAAWRTLKPYIKNGRASDIQIEVLNEPNVTDGRWRMDLASLLPRLYDLYPDHHLIIGPAPFQRYDALISWEPFAQPNLIYAFHYYDPMIFTHQGQTWDTSAATYHISGLPFPLASASQEVVRLQDKLKASGKEDVVRQIRNDLSTAWTTSRIRAAFQQVSDWRDRTRTEVVLNEFGALSGGAPRASRLGWLRTVRECADIHHIGWVHWSLAGGFGILSKDQRLDDDVVSVLLPKG